MREVEAPLDATSLYTAGAGCSALVMQLVVCVGCRRHVRAGDARCPFCATERANESTEPELSPVARLSRAALVAGVAASASMTLAACYGGPPRRGPEPHDQTSQFDVANAEPSAFVATFAKRARGAGCLAENHDGDMIVRCSDDRGGEITMGLVPRAEHVEVRCLADMPTCRMHFDRIQAVPIAGAVPPLGSIEPPPPSGS